MLDEIIAQRAIGNDTSATFPAARPRRLRRTQGLRRMVREPEIGPGDFIFPLFVTHGAGVRQPISSILGRSAPG